MSKSILVIGGAGFIGSHLVERLLTRGDDVTCLDNFDPFYDRQIKERNLKALKGAANFRYVTGDVRDLPLLRRLFGEGRFETVVHLAARPGVRPSIQDPSVYYKINVMGLLNLLEVGKSCGLSRLLVVSSSSVYGAAINGPANEDETPLRPLSPYAASKIAAEMLSYTYSHLYGITIVVLRPFTVYGPRQRPDMAISRFTRMIDCGEEVPVYGDGSSQRDYTYVTDIAAGIEAALERPQSGFHIFNLGRAQPVELRYLISLIEKNVGKSAKLQFLDLQPGEPSRTFADITKAKAALGYQPAVSIEEGIHRFVDWYRENQAANG